MRRLWAFVGVLGAVALVLLGLGLQGLQPVHLAWAALVAAVLTWSELYPLNVSEDGELTMSALIQIACLVGLGPQASLLGALLAEVAYGLLYRRPAIKTTFNAAQIVVSVWLAQRAFIAVGGTNGSLTIEAVALALVYIVVNTGLVAVALALSQGRSLWTTWLELNRDTLGYSVILTIGGLAFAGLALSYGALGLVTGSVMLWCLRSVLSQANQSVRTTRAQLVQTVKVIMTAVEYRDPYTYGHGSRAALLCRRIAAHLGLPPQEVDLIELGGLLHDLGNVGVPDAILNKADPLTPEEFNLVKAHPVIGERIILGMEGVLGVERLAAMARQHHMFYNGDLRGYPEPHAGETLYVGARILSVADAWDAMTTDRPYRSALPRGQALLHLLAGRGTRFDPAVVDALVAVLEREDGLTRPTGIEGEEPAYAAKEVV